MALHPEDKSAAFIGLIVTAVLLVLMSFTIVTLTNRKYVGETKAEATK